MQKRRTEIGLILGGAILLCFIAWFNNFPLVYSDTADYLGGAFGGYIPPDRPVFYGLFMKMVSLHSSLWLVVFVQGILTSYLLFETFGIFYSGNKRNYLFIISVAVLTLCTGISHNVSILLPDIFSAIGIMCFINLLLNNKLNRVQYVVISLILIICVLVHFSNMLVLLSLCGLIFLYAGFKKVRKQPIALKPRRIMACFAIISSVLLIAPIGNYLFAKKFIISGGAHVFMMNHLIETGILEEYLKNECGKKDCKMCQFKDNMDTGFMWDGNSPLWKLGGWDGSKDEFNRIIGDIMTTPKYQKMVIKRFTEYSFMQFFTFNIPANTNWGVPPYIKDNYRIYGRDFCASLQSSNRLDYSFTNQVQRVLVLLSFAFLIYVVCVPACFRMLSTELKWFTVLLIVFSILNSVICANFSTINERFQNRIIWLFPLTVFFIIEKLVSEGLWKKKTDDTEQL